MSIAVKSKTGGSEHTHAKGTHQQPMVDGEPENYLNTSHSIKSWLLTTDHKRIALLYLISISVFFAMGGLAAGVMRAELTGPNGQFMSSESYNKMFSAHGIIMVFFFLVPVVPATLGNFMIPIMIGARDLAFPRLNLFSWYLYLAGGTCALLSIIGGGVDTGVDVLHAVL
jgi:cytochrome c oxidase subunit I